MSSAVEVLVIGSGAAGLIAAVEAAEAGASTHLFESEATFGGSTALSGGYVTLCETDLQPGSRQELLEDLLHSHADDCQEDLSQLYVDTAPVLYSRLRELGLEFVRTYQFAHMRRPWAHELGGLEMTGGAEIVSRLTDAARQRGARLEASSRVTRLHADGNGRVVAADVETGDNTRRVEIGKGVIIASGGFTRNPDFIANFGRPGTTAIYPVTGAGSRGDGLKLAMGLGAATAYMTIGIAPTIPADPATGKGVNTLYVGGIALNKKGRRFCNESQAYSDTCWMALQQPDVLIVQVYDDTMKAALAETMMGRAFAGYRELSAPTLDALLATVQGECGFDSERAAATIYSYNREVEAVGSDTLFGRQTMVGDVGVPAPIEQAPFHAVITRPGTTHFNGGLAIDAAMRVRNVYGEPIDGLFAAGEVTGGFHGAGYLSGTFVGMALAFGMIAGRNAAAKGS